MDDDPRSTEWRAARLGALWGTGGRGVLLRLRDVGVAHPGAEDHPLRDVSLDCSGGTWTVLTGPPRSGRTTLLRCAAGLDQATSGQVWRAEGLRSAHVGLVPAAGSPAGAATELFPLLLRRLGVRDPERPGPDERRGVELAAALASRPDLLLLDHPTGGMGATAASAVFDLLRDLVDTAGLAVLMAADDVASISRADTVVLFADGAIVGRDDLPPA